MSRRNLFSGSAPQPMLLTILIVALTLTVKTNGLRCNKEDNSTTHYKIANRGGIEWLPKNCGGHAVRSARSSPSAADRVSGGYSAVEGEFPAYVYLATGVPKKFLTCGGTILDRRRILTAAHCVTDKSNRIVNEVFVLPTLYKPKNPFKSGIRSRKVCRHRNYISSPDPINDVAIILLNQDLPISRSVQPACLPQRDITSNQQAYSIGLGKVQGITKAKQLQVLPTKLTGCEGSYPRSVICFGSSTRRYVGDTCGGDSGGGVYFVNPNNKLVVAGVTSFGPSDCQPGVRTISGNANVKYLLNEIDSLLKECS